MRDQCQGASRQRRAVVGWEMCRGHDTEIDPHPQSRYADSARAAPIAFLLKRLQRGEDAALDVQPGETIQDDGPASVKNGRKSLRQLHGAVLSLVIASNGHLADPE